MKTEQFEAKEHLLKQKCIICKKNFKLKVNWYYFVKLFNIIGIVIFMGYGMSFILSFITKIGSIVASTIVGIWLYLSLNRS